MGGYWPPLLANSRHLFLQLLSLLVKNSQAPESFLFEELIWGGSGVGQAESTQNIPISSVLKEGSCVNPDHTFWGGRTLKLKAGLVAVV